ncbi:polysaccharide biosynthesis/export family protein [Pedobacter sp. Hv1]|uniref:polysaccharide biosynthesis/export family protein n=1 Tax=Pedobacter sp. Hv1 TaxID=1740090 RepID=UPI0006D8D6D4|nr:polysaccharide biosynthesis/export family protein [Pedobacter sp. Hv1]KQB99617.1 sugar transporter [Pedobacter sp. Hv1]
MKKTIYLFITVLFLSSCGVKYKYVPYFTDLPRDSEIKEKITNQTTFKVQVHDVLAITVSSPSPEAAAMFNVGTTSSVQNENNTNVLTAMNGFAVDEKGDIQIPLVGAVKIVGLSLAEVRLLIQEKLTTYLKNPVVNIRLANFKISILGDVAKPGVYPINNQRVNIAEALSLAGDLNITARRQDVLLVREIDGERKYIRFDMQSKDVFNSPYYYLQNNDVLYIQPDKVAYSNVDNSYRNVGIILSVISILSIFLSRL